MRAVGDLGGSNPRNRHAAPGLRARFATGLLAAALALGSAAGAQAAGFLEKNFWLPNEGFTGNVPACDTPAALSMIQDRFATTESRFWSSSLRLSGFDHVKEVAFRPWGPEFQPRRYCSARVHISDGHTSSVYYSIIEDGGFLGLSWGVDWCVVGLDRGWGHPPNCEAALP